MAHASGTLGCPVGERNIGTKLIAFANKIKIEIAPTNGRYSRPSWPTFSSSKSRIPTPMEFVRRSSITCWVPPGRSAEIRGRSQRKKTTANRQTSTEAATKFGIGFAGCLGAIFRAAITASTAWPKSLFSRSVNQFKCSFIRSSGPERLHKDFPQLRPLRAKEDPQAPTRGALQSSEQ